MYKKITFILIFLNAILFVVFSPGGIPAAEIEEVRLTLEEVSALALSNNFDIQLAKFDAQYKETDLDKAKSIYDTVIETEAKFKDDQRKTASNFIGTKSETRDYNFGISQKLPTGTTLKADFDNRRSWDNSGYITVNPAHDSSANLTLEQELGKNFFGIADRSDVKITKIDIENAQYTSLDKIERMLSDVHKAYWRIAQYLSIAGIREEMLSEAERLFRINKEKFRRGIIEEPQLVASEVNVRQREIDLMLVRNELEYYINQLKLLLNLEDKDKIILPEESLDLAIQPVEFSQALETAFRNRRDYFMAKNEVGSKDIKLVMKKNNLWPEINLEASVTRNGLDRQFSEAVKGISSEDNPEYFLGLRIEFPLQNREAKSEFNKAKIEKAKALLSLKKIERLILVDINDSVRSCRILEQRANKQKKVVELQEEKLAAETERYKYGRSDTDTVIRYQDDLLLSRLLYAQALLDYKEALIDLSLKENVLLGRFWKDTL
ncbi:MAG: TolC family protein [Candidatus Omnitrophota bacterium]